LSIRAHRSFSVIGAAVPGKGFKARMASGTGAETAGGAPRCALIGAA
jgi:hypothetical protein